MFGSDGETTPSESDKAKEAPEAPLSPMKKGEEVDKVLNQCSDSDSKLIALAQIMKKDRKKMKVIKQALAQEIQKNETLSKNIDSLSDQIDGLREEIQEKDERIVKTYGDYMSTYESLLKLRNEQGTSDKPRQSRKAKKRKKNLEGQKDIFDNFIEKIATKAPRMSVQNPDLTKSVSNDVRKSPAAFNMSGGGRKESDSSTTEDDYTLELEEENKRLQNLIEYKDYELKKKRKDEDFGYDCFADLRSKFDQSLKDYEEKNSNLQRTIEEKEETITQLQTELKAKDDEISKIDEKYSLIIAKKQEEHKKQIEDLQSQLSHHSKEIVDNFQAQIAELKKSLEDSDKEKRKYLDEKLKIEEIIDQQVEQVEYWNHKAMKLEDELALRKQIEDEVTENLRKKEEQVRILLLEKEEEVIKSFSVKFINIEESKSTEEVLTEGTVES